MAISSYESMTGRSTPANVTSATQAAPSTPDQGSAYTAVTGRELPKGVTSVSQNEPSQYVIGTGDGGTAAIVNPPKTTTRKKPRYDSKGKLIGYDVEIVNEFGDVVSTSFEALPADNSSTTKNIAYDTISKILESYNITGLASVLEDIRKEYPEASSADLLTLLQFDDRYNAKFNERFSANAIRQKAGMKVLSPAEYLALEQGYKKTLSSYGLSAFQNQAYYDKFISNDMSTTELTDRVTLAYDRVLNDSSVRSAFEQFFPSLTVVDIVTGLVDPVNQFPALERKVKAAEIGGAAVRQGLSASELSTTPTVSSGYTNVTTSTVGADVLGQQGLTKAGAETGYQAIAQVLPTAEKLSSIYGGRVDQYGRLEAEQEKLQGLASAARKRQQLSALEEAQFRGSSGVGPAGLSTNYLKKSSSAGLF